VECCWAAGTVRLLDWEEVGRGTVEAAAVAGSVVGEQRLDDNFEESR